MSTPVRHWQLDAGRDDCSELSSLSLKSQRNALTLWLVLSDAAALGLALLSAFWIRFDLHVTVAPSIIPPEAFYTTVGGLLVLVFLALFFAFGLYDFHNLLGGVAEYAKVFHACTTGGMLVVAFSFFQPEFVVSRVWLVCAWLGSFVLVATNRFITRRIVYSLRTQGYFLSRTLIVGGNGEAQRLAHDLSRWRKSGLHLVGSVGTGRLEDNMQSLELPVLGSVPDIENIVVEQEAHEVIVCVSAIGADELFHLYGALNRFPQVEVRLSSGIYELLTTGVTVRSLGSVSLMSVNKLQLTPQETLVKTLIEYTLTTLLLLLIWPLLLLIAILVKLDSKGPAIHRRRVLGVGGVEFDAFKFRTMYADADERLRRDSKLRQQFEKDFKLKEDPRVTRVGRVLRKYSLDEFPQFFNVLLGQMSLVGPRMITSAEAGRYGRDRFNLLTVRPGITGLWQVSGRSDLSYAQRVELDMHYIRNYSIWLDLQVLFVQTPPVAFGGRGAY